MELEKRVDLLVRSTLQYARQSRAIEVSLNRWFGKKWCGFSHKASGALGVHNRNELRVPPFVHDDIEESDVELRGDVLLRAKRTPSVHVGQVGGENRKRLMGVLFGGVTTFWFGREGNRLSMMAYVWNGNRHIPFYLEMDGALVKAELNVPKLIMENVVSRYESGF